MKSLFIGVRRLKGKKERIYQGIKCTSDLFYFIKEKNVLYFSCGTSNELCQWPQSIDDI